MRYHTKEYYTLEMSLGASELYEPVIDKEAYTEEEIAEMYQQAMDRYIEEERADYDAPPEYLIDLDDVDDPDPDDYTIVVQEQSEARDRLYALAVEDYENRPPFDEDEAREEFEEMYNDNLEEPDEDLPDWVREAVDPRILAMYCMPEKIYRKLSAEDEANEARYDELDDIADEAFEKLRDSLPEQYVEFMDIFEELEDLYVVRAGMVDGFLEIVMVDWDDNGDEEEKLLRFGGVEFIEDEGLEVKAWEDEDGDTESDCEFLYGEIYKEEGRPEVHMMFDNNGLKYLTFRCDEASAFYGGDDVKACIKG